MTKLKTAFLTGKALEWAVAKSEGRLGSDRVYISNTCAIAEGKLPEGVITAPESVYDIDVGCLGYSTDWAQGGPIIEREKIKIFPNVGGSWSAQAKKHNDDGTLSGVTVFYNASSDSPLEAAMRCYVASKLGGEVELDIPEEVL